MLLYPNALFSRTNDYLGVLLWKTHTQEHKILLPSVKILESRRLPHSHSPCGFQCSQVGRESFPNDKQRAAQQSG